MKKIIVAIFMLISIISFGQNKEYRKAVNLFNAKKYAEANVIIEKLLNKEYGDLDEVTQLYTLNMNLNCYIYTNDNKMAYSKALVYFDFIKNSNEVFIDDKSKNKAIVDTEKLVEDLKTKISKDISVTSEANIASESSPTSKTVNSESKVAETTTSITDNQTSLVPSSATKTDNTETKVAETTKPLSDDKTVTLTVSGTGKTIEEAKLNALRSAIEQAFGAFISSKTEILNDNLIKDEIVSVASGNVQKYDVVSQIEIPNNGYAVTLNATVSIAKLTSFAESKGVVAQFKGGMFGANIKLQKLNEEAEYIALKNLCKSSFELLLNSIDYNIEIGAPKSNKNVVLGVGTNEQMRKNRNKIYNYMYDFKNGVYIRKFNLEDFTIDITVNLKSNNNLKLFYENFIKTIVSMSMDASEVKNYETFGKSIISITIGGKEYFLRNPKSDDILKVFFTKVELIPRFFEISNNINEYNNLLINRYSEYHDYSFINWKEKAYADWDRLVGYEDYAQLIANKINILPLIDDLFSNEFQNEDYKKMRGYYSFKNSYVFDFEDFKDSFVISRSFSLEELEKLDNFEIKKINLLDVLKKEEERQKKVIKIITRMNPDRIFELNGEKAKEDTYIGFVLGHNSINYGELIEIKDNYYIIKSFDSHDKKPGLIFKLIPDKYDIIKEDGYFFPN